MSTAIAVGGLIFVLAVLQVIVPGITTAIGDLIADMTMDKPQSSSGQQRLFWAMQGWYALFDSYGLGVGPGSFRSSSIVTAILGSVGALGATAFLLYLAKIFEWSRRSSWGIGPTPRDTLAGALGSAALLCLIPATMLAPHAAPSVFFCILGGAAIGLRRLEPEARRSAELAKADDYRLGRRASNAALGLARQNSRPARARV